MLSSQTFNIPCNQDSISPVFIVIKLLMVLYRMEFIYKLVADKTVAIALEQGGEATDGVITLNETGAFIFSLINDGADFDTVAEKFFDEYDVTKEEAVKAVENFVEYLKNADLLEDDGQTKMKL